MSTLSQVSRIFKIKKSWYIDYNLDGKRIRKVIGKSKKIAQLALADIPKNYTDLDYPPGVADDYYEFKINDPNAFFLRAEGDCMAPYIIKGDLLLIAPNDRVKSGEVAVVVNSKGEKEVRRITIRKDQFILTPDNPAYPTIVWEAKDKPKLIGRVKEIIRRR